MATPKKYTAPKSGGGPNVPLDDAWVRPPDWAGSRGTLSPPRPLLPPRSDVLNKPKITLPVEGKKTKPRPDTSYKAMRAGIKARGIAKGYKPDEADIRATFNRGRAKRRAAAGYKLPKPKA